MSEQWQIRRGTTAENDNFTGAEGEITMDTDKKQLRVHDGQTQGGAGMIDPIVAFQVPTAENNYTWYRKYRSGWIEQGGIYDTGSDQTANNAWNIPLLVEMSDTHYTGTASMGGRTSGGSFGGYLVVVNSDNTTTTMEVYVFKTETAYRYINWQVCGMAAA